MDDSPGESNENDAAISLMQRSQANLERSQLQQLMSNSKQSHLQQSLNKHYSHLEQSQPNVTGRQPVHP